MVRMTPRLAQPSQLSDRSVERQNERVKGMKGMPLIDVQAAMFMRGEYVKSPAGCSEQRGRLMVLLFVMVVLLLAVLAKWLGSDD